MTWTRINLEAALEELSRAPGKAELINGEVVLMAPTGDAPGTAGDEIYFSLRKYVEQTSRGHAVADNKAFRADLPHRSRSAPMRRSTRDLGRG